MPFDAVDALIQSLVDSRRSGSPDGRRVGNVIPTSIACWIAARCSTRVTVAVPRDVVLGRCGVHFFTRWNLYAVGLPSSVTVHVK